ncbi:hypothetical protein BDV93DRAFT_21275 [Ceratobasidium sp. AG-I]|nr:hypothetical protein BDV93DRAFT_21275 [Ceratobasidium sp. AG-I]
MPSTPSNSYSTSKKPLDVSQSYSAPIMESKDKRAHHTDRQRALHAGDRRKGKGSTPKSHYGPRGYYAIDAAADDFSINDLEQDRECPCCLSDRSDVGMAGSRAVPEVTLAEIIKPGRKRKGVASDFEIVPRPGGVLALPIDEGFEDEDEDLYAEWEDVSGGGLRRPSVGHESARGNVAKVPLGMPPVSYAAALSAHR